MSEQEDGFDEFSRRPEVKLTDWEWFFSLLLLAMGFAICFSLAAIMYVIWRFFWALAFS